MTKILLLIPAVFMADVAAAAEAPAGMAAQGVSPPLTVAAVDRKWLDQAVGVVIAAVFERTAVRYGERGEHHAHVEVGHAAQNLLSPATAVGLRAPHQCVVPV